MDNYIIKSGKKLRCGYTTGSCVAAACKAAALLLLKGEKSSEVELDLPNDKNITIPIKKLYMVKNSAVCAVEKFSGDDPDVTDKMDLFVLLTTVTDRTKLFAGDGIGVVTKHGLSCEMGEPAINPVPRKMIMTTLSEVSEKHGYKGGFYCTVFAPNGKNIAKRTFNERLGVVGGISVLGTSGIVEPMSETAIIKTIEAEIRQRKGEEVLLVTPGNYGVKYAKDKWELDIDFAVKCSNFFGDMLDYAVYCGFRKILIIAHAGKLCKLAAGVMQTHSKNADARAEVFAAHAALNGAKQKTVENIFSALTTEHIHNVILQSEGMQLLENVYKSIEQRIKFNINYRTSQKAKVEFIMFTNEHGTLIETENAREFVKILQGE